MSRTNSKTVIVVVGPTAVGKTSVAIDIAKHFGTEIISADSRQCYKELNIGVARPSVNELSQVTHHFIASHSISDEVNAATFEKFALETLEQLFRKYDHVVLVGGTGLYVKAFCEGLDEIPAVKTEIRNDIISNYEKKGIGWLQDEIKVKDPAYFKAGEILNPQRMMRALEVLESTGRSVLEFRKGKKAIRPFNIIKIGLELPKEQLHRQIHERVDRMIEQGLVDEVKQLKPYAGLNALQTVGYAEIFEYLNGSSSLEEAVNRIKTNTRQYAKRQMTWFKKDKGTRWFHPTRVDEMIDYLGSK